MTLPQPVPADCPGIDDCHAAQPIHLQLAELREGQRRLEAGQRILASGHVQVVEQVAEITLRLDRHERQLADLSTVPGELAANTAATRDVLAAVVETRDMVQFARDAQVAGRLGARIARAGTKLIMGVAALITATAGAWWAWVHGGPPKP